MNYLKWNNAIIKHFFNPENEEKEVMLYFSESIIEEIGNNNFPKPDNGYIEDFYNALRLGLSGITNNNYIQRILLLEQKYRTGCRSIENIDLEYPPYLTYLLSFILPFTSGVSLEDCNMNNFHDIVKDFFDRKNLSNNYNIHIKNHLIEIDNLWIRINEWLIEENNFSLGYLEEIKPPTVRKFVGKFEYHILFRKEQEERLSLIFDKEDIVPGEVVNEDQLRNLIVRNYRQLKISANTRDRIGNVEDYIGKKILKRALSFYKNWDGITHTVEGQRGYSRNRLVLCLDFNFLSQNINLKYFRIFSVNGLPNNLRLEKQNGEILEEKIHQINSFYSNPISNCFIDLNTGIQLVDNSARNKYNWKRKDFLIFKKMSNFDWVEIPKVEYNVGKTLIVCQRTFYEQELKTWFDNIINYKKLFDDNAKTNLPNEWMAFTIESITDYPHSAIQELIPDPELKPKINFDKSFYMDGKLFKDKLPIVWLENTEIIDNVFAKYEDDSEILLKHLTQEEEGITSFVNQFAFTDDHTSSDKLNQHFKLVCNNISSHRFLQITEFHKKNNSELENLLPKRDVIGQLTSSKDNYFKGIEHFFSQNKISETLPYQSQLNNIFINQRNNDNYRQNDKYDYQQIGNLLIHYIATKGQLSKQEFNDSVFTLLENIKNGSDNIKKTAIRLGYLLQELGYVDYDSSRSTFCINKPHLVVIPVAAGTKFNLIGARDAIMINQIINYCKQNTSITVEILTNDSNKLLPQTINLYLRKCDHSLINQLANRIGIIFKKDKLFTQFALTSCFPDIGNWKNYINETQEYEIKDIEGGYLFDIESLKFINKPYNYEKDLSFIKLTEINGYKTIYRLWYNSTCFSIPDQQLGIYLFLYLYKKLREDKYNQCVEESGRYSCGLELEQKDIALTKTNIIVFDRERKLMAVPLSCRLPGYISLSFQLLSGKAPIVKFLEFEAVRYKGVYHIYQNVPNLFLENILNNTLLKRNVMNSIINKQIIL